MARLIDDILSGGQIRGASDGKVVRFLGVPYAAPPSGARRFAPPAPVEPWREVRDATLAGPMQRENRRRMSISS